MQGASAISAAPSANLDTRAIWAIALPAMITNVATALIGLGDMWIVGRLGDASAQGAVDVGARLFAVLFTVMNFLKTGTTGLVAQEGTRAGAEAQVSVLLRGMTVGLAIAALLLIAKPVLLPLCLSLLGADGDVLEAARVYAGIRYWTAPGVMLNLALVGFLVGRRQMTAVLIIEVAYNLTNVGLGLWFVLGLDLGIAGIGWSSFIAEYAKLAAVVLFVFRGSVTGHALKVLSKGTVLRWRSLRPFLSVNRDLFLRTVILTVALATITRLSADRGEVVLAANGIIYQLFVLTALLLDGFENAAQVLNGERIGAHDRHGFAGYVRALIWRGIGAAALVAALFLLLSGPILASFAATAAVESAAREVSIWLIVIPFAGVAGFVFDGVFVGASWTRALLVTMVGAAMVYALALWLTWPLGNHGLWLSFTIFLIARACFQAVLLPRLTRKTFAAS
ncbi:MATE family efflux transporter [Qipengyuania atrilutea]|uniref:MATE family efflux transporter n=1 Tax=Qipengyuania atrilutea TaxID=2744473 RepID=A0A850H0W4_9SPHN|nr:MATE family efflux transporter [Actirhodobacter atriluteus]NVD45551.1 MATE family efflux transporter [Actirhodobacter atriluteus]